MDHYQNKICAATPGDKSISLKIKRKKKQKCTKWRYKEMFSDLSSGMWFGLTYTGVVMNYEPLAQSGILSLYRDARVTAESGLDTEEKNKHKFG